jgi:hypothetical protein
MARIAAPASSLHLIISSRLQGSAIGRFAAQRAPLTHANREFRADGFAESSPSSIAGFARVQLRICNYFRLITRRDISRNLKRKTSSG